MTRSFGPKRQRAGMGEQTKIGNSQGERGFVVYLKDKRAMFAQSISQPLFGMRGSLPPNGDTFRLVLKS